MDSKTLSELKRQYGVLTTAGIAIRGDVDRIEAVRAVLGQLRSVKLKTRTGTLIHPIDALFRPEEQDESAYLFDEENRWLEFHLGEDRGVIDFQSDFGISHLNVELGGATPWLPVTNDFVIADLFRREFFFLNEGNRLLLRKLGARYIYPLMIVEKITVRLGDLPKSIF